jgi:hypothetical protein
VGYEPWLSPEFSFAGVCSAALFLILVWGSVSCSVGVCSAVVVFCSRPVWIHGGWLWFFGVTLVLVLVVVTWLLWCGVGGIGSDSGVGFCFGQRWWIVGLLSGDTSFMEWSFVVDVEVLFLGFQSFGGGLSVAL